ncbi:MAG: YbaB/EbfC family nucleoid-associated protein [Pseudomonadota bacterium]
MFGKLGDMAGMMKKVSEMQEKMAEATERMESIEAEGSAGAGMVKAVCTAKGELKSLTVDPSLLSGEEEKEVLEDLIVAAVNDASKQAREAGQEEMAKVTEGLPLPPGFKMPFG